MTETLKKNVIKAIEALIDEIIYSDEIHDWKPQEIDELVDYLKELGSPLAASYKEWRKRSY